MPETEIPVNGNHSDVAVFLEQTGGIVEDVSLEILGKGREIADTLGARLLGILLGQNTAEAAKDCAARGADTVYVADSPLLSEFTTEAYARALSRLVEETKPGILLVGATHNGTALAASVAVRLKAGLMAHVVDLEVEPDGALLGSVPGFGGSIVAVCRCKKGRPQIATVRPGIFKQAEKRESVLGAVVPFEAELGPEDPRCAVVEKHVSQTSEIGRATRVVVAGLGCGADLSTMSRLADMIKGSLAVSRPLADKGLATKDLVVGSTGTALNAKLAIVAGVSGAAHFVFGVKDVGTVIAINSDPEALIFNHADYCVVGDASKITSMLITELGRSQGGALAT